MKIVCVNAEGEEIIPCQYDDYYKNMDSKEAIIVLCDSVGAEACYIKRTEGGNFNIVIGDEYSSDIKFQEYLQVEDGVGYGLCISEKKIPYSYNGNHAWNMKTLKKSNKYMTKVFTTDTQKN